VVPSWWHATGNPLEGHGPEQHTTQEARRHGLAGRHTLGLFREVDGDLGEVVVGHVADLGYVTLHTVDRHGGGGTHPVDEETVLERDESGPGVWTSRCTRHVVGNEDGMLPGSQVLLERPAQRWVADDQQRPGHSQLDSAGDERVACHHGIVAVDLVERVGDLSACWRS
jgi:hypothetical protein